MMFRSLICQRRYFPGGLLVLLIVPATARADSFEDLLAAARSGDVATIHSILAASPGLVDKKDRQGDTPLFAAVESFQLESMETLLRAGASTDGTFRRNMHMLQAVAYFGNDNSVTPERRRAAAAMLLKHGASVTASDEQKVTPLHVAAMRGHIGLMDLFLEAGADLNARDFHERTPMHMAAVFNKVDVIRWLIEHKADPSPKDRRGNTPLHSAVSRFRKEASSVLIELGADVNATDDRRRTPLHLTATAGPPEEEVDILMADVAELLLEHGANPKAWDNANKTALQYAREKGRKRVAAVVERYLSK